MKYQEFRNIPEPLKINQLIALKDVSDISATHLSNCAAVAVANLIRKGVVAISALGCDSYVTARSSLILFCPISASVLFYVCVVAV